MRERNKLFRLLRDSDCRLRTLIGPGNIGKTRLAIEIVSKMVDMLLELLTVLLRSANPDPVGAASLSLLRQQGRFLFSVTHKHPPIASAYQTCKFQKIDSHPGIHTIAETRALGPVGSPGDMQPCIGGDCATERG